MKKLVSLTLALVMIVTCLAGISFAADPIATIETNGKTVEATTLEELLAAIDPSGKSVVTMKADVTGTAQIKVPYSCYVDLGGHSWSTPTAGNAFAVQAAGSENPVTVIKNGVIDGNVIGIRVNAGALQLENVIVQGRGSVAVAIYETNPQYNDLNKMTGCTLVSTIWGAFGFNHQTEKQTGMKYYIENTKLISTKEAGSELFSAKMGDGTVVLGKGVELYTYKPDGWQGSKTLFEGETAKAEFALAQVEIPELNIKAAGMSYWHTPENTEAGVEIEWPEAPVVPEVPATPVPDVTTPATGVSVAALGVMAVISLAGAVITKKH